MLATAKDTNGAYSCIEEPIPRGPSAASHIHEAADESCYIIEGDGLQTEPSALVDLHAYVQNLVAWLAPVAVVVASRLENRVIVSSAPT